MTIRRSLVSAVLALGLMGAATLGTRAVEFTTAGVSFKVDDTARTITVTARLAFYTRGCNQQTACASSATDAASVGRIVKAIEAMWNTGLKVKCYRFVVKVEAHSVSQQSDAGQDEVDIGLDGGPIPLKGYVAFVRGEVHGGQDSNPLGNTPADRIDVVHDEAAPTTWPLHTYDQVYAHEFGHILGLDDNYDKADSRVPVKGASEDLMFRKQGVVTDEMAKRVVERSGQVNLKDLKCGWNIAQASPDGYTLKGTKCDDTDGEWTFGGKLTGQLRSESTYTVTIAKGALTGTFQESTVSDTSVAVITINAHGTASVAIQPDGSVRMTLDATTATSKAVAAGSEAIVQVPLPARTFVWQANTGAECAIQS